jgi:hypothetical protein
VLAYAVNEPNKLDSLFGGNTDPMRELLDEAGKMGSAGFDSEWTWEK